MEILILFVLIALVIAFFRWLFTGIISERWFRAAGTAIDWAFRLLFLAVLAGIVGFIVYAFWGIYAALGTAGIVAYLVISRIGRSARAAHLRR